ncbi:hypothetical protein PIB30_093355 [Stylosanthes scabra]|uniref:F-box domain-containing protein n=1 Tax=Stylosanthes scabra TaxID=79078 RepID=A0ABU6RV25_9FABA|nr:hypothetical protein [Stylosanthes scabra]
MSDTPAAPHTLRKLDDEILWRIFTKTDPKTATKCRALSKLWELRFKSPLFAKHNYRENRDKNMQVLAAVACPGHGDDCFSLLRVDMQTREQCEGNVHQSIRFCTSFQVLGSSHGVICLKFSLGTAHSELAVWNPLIGKRIYTNDQSSKHKDFAISLYAFGHVFDLLHYAIVHGVATPKPKSIVSFNLRTRVFAEEEIPRRAKSTFHTLSIVRDEVAFVSSFNPTQLSTAVEVFQVTRAGSSGLSEHKIFRIPAMGVPFTPTMFIGKYLLNVVESRSGPYNSNDVERTDLLIGKHDYEADKSQNLLSRTWGEMVHIRTVCVHSPGIYTVE